LDALVLRLNSANSARSRQAVSQLQQEGKIRIAPGFFREQERQSGIGLVVFFVLQQAIKTASLDYYISIDCIFLLLDNSSKQ
jgi:hypothetical protein